MRERTAEITALREEEKQMMIDISHGLQTPLTIVKSELGFLRKRDKKNKHLKTSERLIDEISRLIYDLLNLARLEMSDTAPPQEEVDLSSLVQEMIEYFEVLAREKDIAIASRIDQEIRIRGSKNQLKELVTNLVSNAFKYVIGKKERKITIALRRLGNRVELTVTDTGGGFPPEDLSKIFNRFYRGSNNTAEETKGTGLGLAIAKKIVEKHEGTIEVTTIAGKGATFTIRLPLSS